jgi:hypothetical protein
MDEYKVRLDLEFFCLLFGYAIETLNYSGFQLGEIHRLEGRTAVRPYQRYICDRDSELEFAARPNELYIKTHLPEASFASLNPAF